MRTMTRSIFLAAVLLFGGGTAIAGEPAATPQATLPDWEHLTPAQRELLLAPLRERWNANPAERARMLRHAQHWQSMDPAQRRRAHRGMHRWEKMDPEHRREMRALFSKMRTLTPPQRDALRKQWRGMTREQRRRWVEANPPRD